MTDPDLRRIETLFHAAADLPAAEREGFLERECAAEPEVRARVEAMLADLDAGESLSGPLGRESASEGPGVLIGRYKLLQQIGEGGFGVVYMAEQEEPVRRRVALKIIKLGMDTREVVARFEAERQALAMMDHPNIARVLDGGATDAGRPYFVMELVRGVSITQYCDEEGLSTRERLELFIPVCHAVQHAHQKGVIHRDIKPSNVMVTLHDGKPVPKVIDFGVAKAMHTRLTEKTLFTAYERFIGTPAYMSPEQAELSGLDVDTRTDIYSLGVLLYELLTGTTPFDPQVLAREGLAAIQRTIREQAPERPSVRISTSGDAQVASRRRVDVPHLSRLVRGDLDWIVMKCLEKERVRRYQTCGDLAADVDRHLSNEPVSAGPPSAAYRMRKFLARNRAGVVSVSVILLVVIGGIIGTSIGLVQALAARGVAQDEADRAEQEAEHARAVTSFLVDTLALTDPDVVRDPDLTVATLLGRASRDLSTVFEGQPQAEARIRLTIGRAYKALGDSAAAEQHLRRAVELLRTIPGTDRAELYGAMWDLTHVLFTLEAHDAMNVAQEARRVAHDYIRTLHPELADALDRFIEVINTTAFTMNPEAGEELPGLFEQTVRASDAALPVGDPLWPMVADTWMAAGYSLWFGPLDEFAGDLWRRAYEIQERELPVGDPQVGETVGLLVGTLNRHGKAAESEGLMRESLARLREVLPEDSPRLALAESMLADNLASQGRFEEAEPLMIRAHGEITRSRGGPATFEYVDSLARVVQMYEAWGREDEARPYREDMARACVQAQMLMPYSFVQLAFGPEQAALRDRLVRLDGITGPVTYGFRVASVSDPEIDSILDGMLADLETLDPLLAAVVARYLLGFAHALDPETLGATRRRVIEAALPLVEPHVATMPYEIAAAYAQLADLCGDEGDSAGARRHARMASDTLPDLSGNWLTAGTELRVGASLLRHGLLHEAEALFTDAHDVLLEHFGPDNPDVLAARDLLARLYTAWGKPEKARAFDASARETSNPGNGEGR